MTESSHTDQTAPDPAGPPADQPASPWSAPANPVPAQAAPVTEPAPSVAEPVAEVAPAPPMPVFEPAPTPPSFSRRRPAPFEPAPSRALRSSQRRPRPCSRRRRPRRPTPGRSRRPDGRHRTRVPGAAMSTAEMAAVPPAPRRRGLAGVIILSVLNFLLLAALGGGLYFRMQTQQQWEADRADRAGQISGFGTRRPRSRARSVTGRRRRSTSRPRRSRPPSASRPRRPA